MRAGWVLGVGVLVLSLVGCKDDPPAGDDGADTGSTGSSEDDGPAPTSSMPTTSSSDSGTSADDGPVDTSADTTTGGVELCGISDDDEVWFQLDQSGSPIGKEGVDLAVECGGQGSFMFQFSVDIYGVDTQGQEWVEFEVTMDIDGFNEDNGHFFARPESVYVGCDIFDGGVNPAFLSLVMPDFVLDPETLDGASFNLEVVMLPDSPDAYTFTTSGVVSATNEGGAWDWCTGGFDTGGDTAGSDSGGSESGSGSGSTG